LANGTWNGMIGMILNNVKRISHDMCFEYLLIRLTTGIGCRHRFILRDARSQPRCRLHGCLLRRIQRHSDPCSDSREANVSLRQAFPFSSMDNFDSDPWNPTVHHVGPVQNTSKSKNVDGPKTRTTVHACLRSPSNAMQV
jgi:hypothetical protein